MSYQRLLLEYAKPSKWEEKTVSSSEKRLCWERDKAIGNSKFKRTGTKVRHAHIVNRNLQMSFDRDVSVWARTHGSKCNEIESKQHEVWQAQCKRSAKYQNIRSADTSSRRTRDSFSSSASLPMLNGKSRMKRISYSDPPFSTVTDFSVYRKLYDPLDKNDINKTRKPKLGPEINEVLDIEAKEKGGSLRSPLFKNRGYTV